MSPGSQGPRPGPVLRAAGVQVPGQETENRSGGRGGHWASSKGKELHRAQGQQGGEVEASLDHHSQPWLWWAGSGRRGAA